MWFRRNAFECMYLVSSLGTKDSNRTVHVSSGSLLLY